MQDWDLRRVPRWNAHKSIDQPGRDYEMVVEYTSLDLDFQDQSWIAYRWDGGTTATRRQVRLWNGGVNTIDTAPDDAGSYTYISLAVDGEDNAGVSYVYGVGAPEPTPYVIKFAFWDGSNWETEDVDGDPVSGPHVNLSSFAFYSLDPQTRPYETWSPAIAYTRMIEGPSAQLRLARWW